MMGGKYAAYGMVVVVTWNGCEYGRYVYLAINGSSMGECYPIISLALLDSLFHNHMLVDLTINQIQVLMSDELLLVLLPEGMSLYRRQSRPFISAAVAELAIDDGSVVQCTAAQRNQPRLSLPCSILSSSFPGLTMPPTTTKGTAFCPVSASTLPSISLAFHLCNQ
jgi:hypothetical protein